MLEKKKKKKYYLSKHSLNMSFPCLDPAVAVNLCKNSDGKMVLQFQSKFRADWNVEQLIEKYGSDNVFLLPCGSCEHCLRNYADDWAIRCTLEASQHAFNYFITLTYDELHINYACLEDLRKFLDRLSGRKHKNKFKFFACMEEGALTHRKHFHIVLFSDFEIDLKEPQWIRGFYYYHSDKIGSLWKFGFHNVAPFETNCARYVAKYTSKGHSKIIMSRNIAYSYYLSHKLEIIKDNFKLYGNFGSKNCVNIPACFVRWFVKDNTPQIEDYKSTRKALGKYISSYSFRNLSIEHHGEDTEFLASRVICNLKGGI